MSPSGQSLWIPVLAGLSGCAFAGERLAVTGKAATDAAGVLFTLSGHTSPAVVLPAGPADRTYVPSSHVRWFIELTGAGDSAGRRGATALRTLPDEVAWPAGVELIPERYVGVADGLNPGLNTLDLLGVAPGSGIPDYDMDGVPDEEDAFPGDPVESLDTDGDGTGNNADNDDDNDGLPDTYEIANGLDPLADDASGDADGDGATNAAEYIAGTNPRNGISRLAVKVAGLPSAAMVRLAWDAVPGRTYSIQRISLLTGPQEMVAENISVTAPGEISRDIPRSSSSGFYILKANFPQNP